MLAQKTNKHNECNCICRNNVIHFQKQLVPTRAVELEPKYFEWSSRSLKFEFPFNKHILYSKPIVQIMQWFLVCFRCFIFIDWIITKFFSVPKPGAGAKNFLRFEPEPKFLDAWSWCRSPKFEFRLYSLGSNDCAPCPWLFICKFFKASCRLVSLSRLAFSPVLFMSRRRLRYLLRMCSYLIETCSTTYSVGNFISNINLTIPKTSGKRSLHLIQTSDHP